MTQKNGKLWSIVLAGGDGRRVRPLIEQWLGCQRPKQYCAFVGTRSLLQHTVARAARLTPGERILVVVDETHRQEAEAQLLQGPPAKLVLQPGNRDTAAGIFFPLSYIHALSPEATVVIFPSDHFVYPEDEFLAQVERVAAAAQHQKEFIFLLGIEPDSPNTDYGWIQPGRELTCDHQRVRSVLGFLEKPSSFAAEAAMASGALWNTLVIVAKANRLWELGREHFPGMMTRFEDLAAAIGSGDEQAVLKSIYSSMPARNFSSDLLQRIPQHLAVAKINGVVWSDWGRPERIVSSLLKIRKEPIFPMTLLDVAGTVTDPSKRVERKEEYVYL